MQCIQGKIYLNRTMNSSCIMLQREYLQFNCICMQVMQHVVPLSKHLKNLILPLQIYLAIDLLKFPVFCRAVT